MTQTISSDLVEKCRAVPIHYLVGDSRVNRKVKIRCPFHPERTASCTLFPAGGYYCFGCGSRGNSLDFAMKLGASFEQAVNDLKIYT